MSIIDYGAIIKKNGVFINKNGKLISETKYMKVRTGEYSPYLNEKGELPICGYGLIGDEDLLISFDKTFFKVYQPNQQPKSNYDYFGFPEVIHYNMSPLIESITVKLLDNTLYPIDYFDEDLNTLEDYVGEYFSSFLNEDGKIKDIKYVKRIVFKFAKRKRRLKRLNYLERHNLRWIVSFTYKNDDYEVIFGSGIDPSERVWNNIKREDYWFSEKEIEIIDSWFNNDRV